MSGLQLLSLERHESQVESVAFNPDGNQIVSASSDHTIRIWDAQSGQKKLVLNVMEGPVLNLAFSPDGNPIVCEVNRSVIIVWDIRR